MWTAAGGLFAEEEQTLDTIREVTGGTYAFTGLGGVVAKGEASILGVAAATDLSALFGGHINLTVTRALDASTSFALQSKAAPESDITMREGTKVVRQPGKVDAYRYMTFYLEPRAKHHDALFDQVADPIWLQTADPAAAALRQARQPGKRPPSWRIMHRVTYVSRVLEPIPANTGGAGDLDRALQQLDLDSNYELIRILDPLVRDRTGGFVEFADAVRAAIRTYLPALEPHADTILAYLVLYYGVADSPGLTPPRDAPAPAVVAPADRVSEAAARQGPAAAPEQSRIGSSV